MFSNTEELLPVISFNANPQVPLAQQANLFAGVAFLHHAVDKVVVFFLLIG
jgi:hypothetical protein